LVGSGWLDQQGEFRSFDSAVDLLGVRHPLHQLLGRWQFEKQMSKYLLRAIDEEFVLPVGGSLKERGAMVRASARRTSSSDGPQ
jgi:hypothetical protein